MSMMIHRAVKRINKAEQPKEVKPSVNAESAGNGAGATAKKGRKAKR